MTERLVPFPVFDQDMNDHSKRSDWGESRSVDGRTRPKRMRDNQGKSTRDRSTSRRDLSKDDYLGGVMGREKEDPSTYVGKV